MRYYLDNPLIHKDRRRAHASSDWTRRFSCEDIRPLIVCRGPVRKEAMDVFDEMGITHYGILLSEKDSIVYTYALAPELRKLTDPSRIHRVPDYTGMNKEERTARVQQIIDIAHENNYNSVFAGYGFMAEDEDFVGALEQAGLNFIGPCSGVVRAAGRKDEAKRTALSVDVSTTPGVDNITALTLLDKAPTRDDLLAVVAKHELAVDQALLDQEDVELAFLSDQILNASYAKGIDLIDIDEVADMVRRQVGAFYRNHPGRRVRLKAIGGGGGKGQRILVPPSTDESLPLEARIEEAALTAVPKVREVLNEVKAAGVGDNKNMLIELNIEQTRHQEIQLLGNGTWSLSLGARDCSVQMHEQKLLEISVTQEGLRQSIEAAEAAGNDVKVRALKADLDILVRMEGEAERFGEAVGLDSLSTFECIVDGASHYFMEVNTRIQVEHRVSELCYALRFRNPQNPEDYFDVDSLVEAMVLLARHGKDLPKPDRVQRLNHALEARLNATNAALIPHAGGLVTHWSEPLEGEIRDDQGISLKNPDTDHFMTYRIAGAYDSNIALLVTHGDTREDGYNRLSEILRRTKLVGEDLQTNLQFHYGLVNWFLGRDVQAHPTTRFVVPYLTLVGQLREQAEKVDLSVMFKGLKDFEIGRLRGSVDDAAAADRLANAGSDCFDRKQTLVPRVIQLLLDDPHLLSGWLSIHRAHFPIQEGQVAWSANPVQVLADTYHYLNLDDRDAPAAHLIWEHDRDLLNHMLHFYGVLEEKLHCKTYAELNGYLQQDTPQGDMDSEAWAQVRSAHAGYQMGLELFDVLPLLADRVGFYDLDVEANMDITIPERLLDPELQEAMARVLAPPPPLQADQISAVCGGMFYSREAPGHEPFVKEGQHFNEGDPLYIIEVMKMFNTVYAPFSGTVVEQMVHDDGQIVGKGQKLFGVEPDVPIQTLDPKAEKAARTAYSRDLLEHIFKRL